MHEFAMSYYFFSQVFLVLIYFFFFNDTATTEIYTLSLHDALPIICPFVPHHLERCHVTREQRRLHELRRGEDRKSTRLNSSHMSISYAVFCLKKKKKKKNLQHNKKNKTKKK